MDAPASTTLRERARRYSTVQLRTVATALDLFADHGVSGTSLQMIADALGVTKAAVYYQFKSKEEIVLAVAEVELQQLEEALEAAEAQGPGPEARDVLLRQVIDLAVRRRRYVIVLQSDPVIVRFLGGYPPFQDLIVRLSAVLLGDDPGPDARVRAAVLTAAIGGAVVHPFITDLDEATLRAELLTVTRRILLLDD